MKAEVVELIDVVSVVLPKRSLLYRLEPVHPFNGLCESLTSYIARLSAAHCLPVWVLVTRELAPLFRGKAITHPGGHCDLLGRFGASINGNNGTAQEASFVVEQLTTQPDLRNLTMLVAGAHLSSTPLMRPTQAWCPHCLDEWSGDEHGLYYPLLWSLAAVRVCPTHPTHLVHRCYRCNRSHHPLARRLNVGYCPWCASWLGSTPGEGLTARSEQAKATEWECYAAKATANLLADLATARQRSRNEDSVFAKNVSGIVEHLFKGSMNAFATFLNCDHETIRDWIARSRCHRSNQSVPLRVESKCTTRLG